MRGWPLGTSLAGGLVVAMGLMGSARAQVPVDDPPPPERTISFTAADSIDAWRLRPMGDLVEADAGVGSAELIPRRESFVGELIESAEQL